jgi:hypothetical protein
MQPQRHLHQDFVAGGASEQVVDRLEPVEIDDADRERGRVVGPIRDQALDLGDETPVVAEPGQGIGVCQITAVPVFVDAWHRPVHEIF